MWDDSLLAVFVVFGFPALIVLLGLSFAAFHRYLKHKEWMAMIAQGIVPEDWEGKKEQQRTWPTSSATAVTITLVGIAITLGLATIGVGPWLIGGLVPTAIGCGLLIGQYFSEGKAGKKGEQE